MRLRDLLRLLDDNIPALQATHENRALGSNAGTYFQNLHAVRNALRKLRGLPGLASDVEMALRHEVIAAQLNDEAHVLQATGNELGGLLSQVALRGDLLRQSLRKVVGQDAPPTAVFVKLADPESLKDLKEQVEVLEAIFDQPARRLFRSGPTVDGVERGSAWIEIGFALGIVLKFTVELIKVSATFMARQNELANAPKQLRELDMPEEVVRQAETKAEEKLKGELYEAVTRAIEDSVKEARAHSQAEPDQSKWVPSIADEGERKEIASYVAVWIPQLVQYERRGMEVHLALSAPKDVVALLPPPEQIRLLANATAPATAILTVKTASPDEPTNKE